MVVGETDAAIAEKLFMSVRTVKQHIQTMRDKTGFRNRTELAVRARESDLVINDKVEEESMKFVPPQSGWYFFRFMEKSALKYDARKERTC